MSIRDRGGTARKGNPLNQFLELVSAILLPILWPLAGAGLLKAFLSLVSTLGWLCLLYTSRCV